MTPAFYQMVIYQPAGLHMRVDHRAADELKTTFNQVFA